MTLRLLCICNPEAYRGKGTDVPLSHEKLAAHPDISLFHTDTRAVQECSSELSQLQASRIPNNFCAAQFDQLPQFPTSQLSLSAFDLAFCRTLKPFAPGYLSQLEHLAETLPFVNHPAGIRQHLQPDFLPKVAGDHLPPWRITVTEDACIDFLQTHGVIVAKRSNSCGGRGVYRISHEPGNRFQLDNLIDGSQQFTSAQKLFSYLLSQSSPLLLMQFLPRVVEGEKRLLVVGGEIYGACLRRSPSGHWLQNVSCGARCELTPVTPTDQELVAHIAPQYQDLRIHLLGIDLLKDDQGQWRLSEINAGNIGGYFRLETLGINQVTNRFVSFLQNL